MLLGIGVGGHVEHNLLLSMEGNWGIHGKAQEV